MSDPNNPNEAANEIADLRAKLNVIAWEIDHAQSVVRGFEGTAFEVQTYRRLLSDLVVKIEGATGGTSPAAQQALRALYGIGTTKPAVGDGHNREVIDRKMVGLDAQTLEGIESRGVDAALARPNLTVGALRLALEGVDPNLPIEIEVFDSVNAITLSAHVKAATVEQREGDGWLKEHGVPTLFLGGIDTRTRLEEQSTPALWRKRTEEVVRSAIAALVIARQALTTIHNEAIEPSIATRVTNAALAAHPDVAHAFAEEPFNRAVRAIDEGFGAVARFSTLPDPIAPVIAPPPPVEREEVRRRREVILAAATLTRAWFDTHGFEIYGDRYGDESFAGRAGRGAPEVILGMTRHLASYYLDEDVEEDEVRRVL